MAQQNVSDCIEQGRKKNSVRIIAVSLILVWMTMLLYGCSFGSRRSFVIEQYTIEYPSPVFPSLAKENAVLAVARFSADQTYNSPAMVYRAKKFQRNVYYYDRWRVSPADMVTDRLIQDLRNSGLFAAVFPEFAGENAGYLLEGEIESFLYRDEGDSSEAELALNVTLFDRSQTTAARRIVFQKGYRCTGKAGQHTAASFAASMSGAVQLFSEQLIRDIYDAIKKEGYH